MSPLHTMDALRQLHHYRIRCLHRACTKTVVLMGLFVASGSLVSQRLSDRALASAVWRGVLVVAAAWAVFECGRWLSREHRVTRGGIGELDRALGLQQRLVTAMEHAADQPPPALLSTLMNDLQHRADPSRMRVPSLCDAPIALLLVVLLGLLAWPPGAARSRAGTQVHRGASWPFAAPAGGRGPGVDGAPHPVTPSDPSVTEAPARPVSRLPEGLNRNAAHERQARDARTRQGAVSGRQSGAGRSNTHSGKHSGDSRADASTSGQRAQDGRGAQEASGGDGAASTPSDRAQQPGTQAASADGASVDGQQAGQDIAMTSSGSESGTGTDPDLYGAEEALAAPGAPRTPLALEGEAVGAGDPRSSGRVGASGGRAASIAPSAPIEPVELSVRSVTNAARATHQPIPPQYRGAFKRLQPSDQEAR